MTILSRSVICCLSAVFCFCMVSSPAFAGGGWDPMRVNAFKKVSETKYVLNLSVLPDENRYVNYGACSEIEIHGAYSYLKSENQNWFVSWLLALLSKDSRPKKEKHLAALRYLEKLAGSNEVIQFGVIGNGIHAVGTEDSCIYESRAIEFLEQEKAVISYYYQF